MEENSKRLEKYVKSLRHVLNTIKYEKEVKEIIELAKCYLRDSEYYFEKGDYFTSLACIAYAEGLLDSLRLMKKAKFTWPRHSLKQAKKVLVGGVFDILHPGHIYLLREASKYGKVIVVVARDRTVKKFKNREPIIPEKQRLSIVENIKCVYRARLGEDPFNLEKVLLEEKPDFVVLGPDQNFLEKMVEPIINKLKLNTKIIKIKYKYSNFPLCSTTKIIKKITEIYSKKEA
ncbi:MAG: DUF357 domain-containing protein [Thermoprotei archaeon]|nr:MAG: DUF357 domain-containing protein [Thermoprotei archaeon]RLF00570.1 MAG: DUF357 domain-containing protein [Thermoprotei archaeon]